jgi:hypothetical protein
LKTEILMKGFLMFEICDFGKSKLAAREWGCVSDSDIRGTVATWQGGESTPLSLILQWQVEVEGWTLPEKDGFDDAGDLIARFPMSIRT